MDCIIDTNVLVDYILLDSALHEKAKSDLEKVDYGFIPSVVIEELTHVLWRIGLDKKVINEKIGEVLDTYEVIGIGEDEILRANSVIMKEEHTSFRKFNDKLILSIAKKKDTPLLTFDGGLIEECKAHGVKLPQFQ